MSNVLEMLAYWKNKTRVQDGDSYGQTRRLPNACPLTEQPSFPIENGLRQ